MLQYGCFNDRATDQGLANVNFAIVFHEKNLIDVHFAIGFYGKTIHIVEPAWLYAQLFATGLNNCVHGFASRLPYR
jgi:hypothetical protein